MIQGFKSFAKKTEVVFDKGINVVLGPNGSGKSNISDALCFVLGRLSIKSMRAAKSKNLMFMGSKYVKPSREAMVELVFDNTDRAFGMDKDEIVLQRIVKYNGQGVYKINGETKTRIEIIELLAQAGIDPHGFNLVLQGQIQAIVKMHPDERRKIIEEVAGISIYELRKEKSIKELEKTEEKLKEIHAILREKTAYLKNLEKERSQALRAKELETTVRRAKFSILSRKLSDKSKELEGIDSSIKDKEKVKNEVRKEIDDKYAEVEEVSQRIQDINKHLQRATGTEQETLHQQIANLKAEIEGLRVKIEGQEQRKMEFERRINEVQKSIPELENEVKSLSERSPIAAQKAQELKKKKEELAKLEVERKKILTIKSEITSLRDRIQDKERSLSRVVAESESLLKQIEESTLLCQYKSEKQCAEAVEKLRNELGKKRESVKEGQEKLVKIEKQKSIAESEIDRNEKVKMDVSKIDLCPLCQSKITEDHIGHVHKESDMIISRSKSMILESDKEIANISNLILKESTEINKITQGLSSAEIELVRHKTIEEKHAQLKKKVAEEETLKKEIAEFEKRRQSLDESSASKTYNDEKYDSILLEIEEISSRTEEDIDSSIGFKQREIENMRNIVKRSIDDKDDIVGEISMLNERFKEKTQILSEKERQEKEMMERFKKLFEEREDKQREVQEKNLEISEMQNNARQIEDQINYLRIGSAKLDAEKQTIETEIVDYSGVEIIQGSLNYLQERLEKSQVALREIGSINMRALEVYEEIKREYDLVAEKTEILEKEKEQIMSIIAEIDKKKLRSFMKTFREINERFSSNFSKVYSKGTAFLEIENKEDVFSGGVQIVVRLAKGKYFDVTSLSGGEQTLVALSLLFAIQEYRPYHFYVFDEIDAALDKRNSERLAALLNQYMKSGQYIVITHNDAIIMNANVLYGVSMHDGVSKILSLELPKMLEPEPSTTADKPLEIQEPKEETVIEIQENEEDKSE